MVFFSLSDLNPLIKKFYADDAGVRLHNLTFYDNPTLSRIKVIEGADGSTFDLPVIGAPNAGASHTAANAIANVTKPQNDVFVITYTKDYIQAAFSDELLYAAKTDKRAFISALDVAMKNSMLKLTNRKARELFQDSTCGVGQIVSTQSLSSTSLTLADPATAINFDPGDVLVASTTNDGGNVRNSGGVDSALTVTAVDFENGILTMSAALNTQGWQASDFLYNQGDAAQGAAPSLGKGLCGFSKWIPSTVDSGTLFGVNRANNSKYSGVRYDGSNQNVAEAIRGGIAKLKKFGGKPSLAVVSPAQYVQLGNVLNSQGIQGFNGNFERGGVGFSKIEFHVPGGGKIDVVDDRSCPDNICWLLQEDTWAFVSRGSKGLVKIMNEDGMQLRLDPNDADYYIRYHSISQLTCSAPSWNCRVALNTAALQ